MNYHAEILADSISPDGVRLTTMLTVYPRFIHSEMLRHRVFSHSVASSRAIPTEKKIETVRKTPFVPATFNQRVKGMGVGAEMEEHAREHALAVWRQGASESADTAEALNIIGLDKSRANRPMEPYDWVSDIITGTDWDNFYALRDHEAAQPEFQTLAKLMRRTQDESDPVELERGQLHLPLITDDELRHLCAARASNPGAEEQVADMMVRLSAGRIARESYAKSLEYEDNLFSLRRADDLMGSGHFSPFEHQAKVPEGPDDARTAMIPASVAFELANAPADQRNQIGVWFGDMYWGNLRGWVQARKTLINESNFGKVDA